MKNKRWLYLIVGAVATLFLGLIYAWSLFVTPIEADLGFSRADTALTFTISMSFFSIGNVAGGMILRKFSLRTTIIFAALFIGVGFIICANISSLIGLFICYGVVLSFGVGLCYISVVSSVNRWFQDRVGTSSGVLMMGFGLGAFVLGGITRALFDLLSWRTTFFALGVTFALIMLAVGFILKVPRPDETLPKKNVESPKDTAGFSPDTQKQLDLPSSQMLRRPAFWLFFVWCIILVAAGLAIIGNAATFAENIGASVSLAVMATGAVSVSNGIGRLVFGSLFDLVGRKVCMFINGLLFVVAMGLLILSANMNSIPFLFVGYICAGLAFGGIPTTNSALTMSFYGPKSFALNFSITSLSIIPGALLGPYLIGLLLTAGGSYNTIFYGHIGRKRNGARRGATH